MARYAMLVAADEYSHFSGTPFCHADAELLKETLVEHCDYASQHVKTLLLSPQQSKTPEELLVEMEDLASGSTEGDTILFFFAGHGDVENGEPYLILPGTEPGRKEATALPLRDVSKRLRLDRRVCVRVLDACHSGYDVRAPGEPNSQDFARAIAQAAFAEGWMTLAACAPAESSYPDNGNGVFTRALSDAIRAVPEKGDVFLESLKLKVCDVVSEWCSNTKRRQTPTFNSAISGNHPIAQRRAKPVRSVAVAPPMVQPVPLTARLAEIRKLPAPGSEVQREAVKATFTRAASLLAEKATSFPAEFGKFDLQRNSNRTLPEGGCRDIVKWLEGKKLKSLHDVGSKTEGGSIMRNRLLSLWESVEPSKTEYHVNLDDWPETRARAEVASDGVCPFAAFWLYVCPLKLRSVLFIGYSVGGKRSFDALLLDQEVVYADVDGAVDRSWKGFVGAYGAAVSASLDELEAEQKA